MTMSVPEAVEAVIEENKCNWVEDYRDGMDGALSFAVDQVMEKTGGTAHPTAAKQFLLQNLHGD